MTSALMAAAQAIAAGHSGGDAVDLNDYLMARVDAVEQALPRGRGRDAAIRFVRLATEEVRRNIEILGCRPDTILGAMMIAAQLDLEFGGILGQCFMGTKIDNGIKVCQFQLGYKGLVQLAGRSAITLQAGTYRPGDTFEWEYGTSGFLRHVPAFPIEGKGELWYAVARFADTRPALFTVIDRTETLRAKQNGDNAPGGLWVTNEDQMSEKTAAHRLGRWLPLSAESAYGFAADGAVAIGEDARVEDVAVATDVQRAEESKLLGPTGAPLASEPDPA